MHPRRFLVTPFMPPSHHSSPSSSSSSSSSSTHLGNIIIFFFLAAVFLAAAIYLVFDYLVRRFCPFRQQSVQQPPDRCDSEEPEDPCLIDLRAIPVKVYLAPPEDGGDGGTEAEEENCSVCLGEYVVGEELRVLPICHHMFHRECIDKWLLTKSSAAASSSSSSSSFSFLSTSCPVCRGSIIDPEMAAAAVATEK